MVTGQGALPIKLSLFIFAGFAWAIWNNRNKMSIENKYFKNLADVYVALSFMQKWGLLLKEDYRLRCTQLKDEILLWMKNFKPSALMSTDVYEI
jgi:hypothetical protein